MIHIRTVTRRIYGGQRAVSTESGNAIYPTHLLLLVKYHHHHVAGTADVKDLYVSDLWLYRVGPPGPRRRGRTGDYAHRDAFFATDIEINLDALARPTNCRLV